MKKVWMVIIFMIIVLLISFVFLNINTKKKIQEIRIGYQPTELYLPLFIAIEKGYFEKEGIQVKPVEFGSANLMMQALLSGQIDATGMSSLSVLVSIEQQKSGQFKMYLFEAFDKKNFPDYILIKQTSNISTLSDLKGKKLGAFPGSTIMSYAKIILRNFMNPEKEIDIIQIEPPIQIPALESEQVDALFTLEPIATTAIQKGVAKALVEAPLAKYIMDPILPGSGVFSSKFIKEQPRAAEKVKKAMYSAVDFIRENPNETKRILPKYTPIDEDIALKINLISWKKIAEVDKIQVQKLIELYYKEGLIEKNIDLKDAYYEIW